LNSRKPLKPTWLGCLRTPTCAPFMPRESLLCPRISSWLVVFEVNVLKMPSLQTFISHHLFKKYKKQKSKVISAPFVSFQKEFKYKTPKKWIQILHKLNWL
jgi:hypothetical protein